MSAEVSEERSRAARCTGPTRALAASKSMTTKAPVSVESDGTTDDEPNDDNRVFDSDSIRAVSIPGAAVIETDAFTRTDGARRFDGAVPLFVVGVSSETRARNALADAGHAPADIERAFTLGAWMERTRPARATAALRVAEQADPEARALTADRQRVMADGGVEECEECGATATPDEFGDVDLVHERDCSHARDVVDPWDDDDEEVDRTPL